MPNVSTFTNRRPSATSAATPGRRSPSAARAAPSARSRCPMRSTTTSARASTSSVRPSTSMIAPTRRPPRAAQRRRTSASSRLRRAREHELHAGHLARHEPRGARSESGRMRAARSAGCPAAAPRRAGQDRSRSRAGTWRDRRRRRDRSIKRMTDELHRNAGLAIDRLLERKDRQHAIDEPLHRLQPAGPPGPELRADVVDDRNAERVERLPSRKLKSGKSIGDEHVGPPRARLRDELPVAVRHVRGSTRSTSDEAGHAVAPRYRRSARAPAPRAAGRRSRRRRRPGSARAARDERAGIEIAGRLAARDHHAACAASACGSRSAVDCARPRLKSTAVRSRSLSGTSSSCRSPTPLSSLTNFDASPTSTIDSRPGLQDTVFATRWMSSGVTRVTRSR